MIFAIFPRKTPIPAPPEMPPARSDFKKKVAGLGVSEAKTRNVNIGTNVAGIVTKIHKKIGDHVKKGDVLFTIDERDAKSRLAVAMVDLQDTKNQLSLYEKVKDKRAISEDDFSKRRFAHERAKATVELIKSEIDRLNVKASIDGTVLRVNIREGEYASTGVLRDPLFILGSIDKIYIRVEIDESDIVRLNPKARAVAYSRGDSVLQIPLNYEYTEPLLTPKVTLSGNGLEKVDTRVAEVVYSYEPRPGKDFIGQQFDVFVEIPDLNSKEIQKKDSDQ
jgi:RND family efflux transporter MFP subunit